MRNKSATLEMENNVERHSFKESIIEDNNIKEIETGVRHVSDDIK